MKNKKLIKKLSLASAIAATAVSLCACSSGANTATADYKYEMAGAGDYYYDDEPMYAEENGAYIDDYEAYDEGGVGVQSLSSPINENQASASVAKNRKLIKTVDLSIETINYDETIANLKQRIESFGGYIENEYSYNGSIYNNSSKKQNKYCNITVRVPDDSLDAFISDVSGIGNVTQKTTSTQDVTLNYVDTESKKQMYLAEQESLLDLLEHAETVEDIAYLTERLTEVRYNIESMESSLRLYDDLVDYATVNFSINEVSVLTPTVVVEKTPAEELKEGFKTSVSDVLIGTRDFFMNLIIRSPYIIRGLICLAIPVLIIFVIVKIIIASVKKKHKKDYENYKAMKEDKKEVKDSKETKDSKESNETKEIKESKESKE